MRLFKVTDRNQRGQFLDEIGTPVKIEALGGRIWRAPRSLLRRNPEQPREYFDRRKLDIIKASIKRVGQKKAIDTVPCIDKSGQLFLLIIDGERRDRVLDELGKEEANIEVHWVATKRELLQMSFLINDTREGHNPIEEAKTYARLIAMMRAEGIDEKDIIPQLAEELGKETTRIKNSLDLLKLPRKFQEMVIDGTLPKKGVTNILAMRRKFGSELRWAVLARHIVDHIDEETSEGDGAPAKLTIAAVREAADKALRSSGNTTAANELRAQQAIVRLPTEVSRVTSAARQVLELKPPGAAVAFLRKRGQGEPPEVLRDATRGAIAVLAGILRIAETAVKPDPLPQIPGKPSFKMYFSDKGRRRSFRNETLAKMVQALAEASDIDGGQLLTTSDIQRKTGCDMSSISSNLKSLPNELQTHGVRLDEHTVRERNAGGDYVKRPGYRLAWIVDGRTAVAAPHSSASADTPHPGRVTRDYVDRLLAQIGEDAGGSGKDGLDPFEGLEYTRGEPEARDLDGDDGEGGSRRSRLTGRLGMLKAAAPAHRQAARDNKP